MQTPLSARQPRDNGVLTIPASVAAGQEVVRISVGLASSCVCHHGSQKAFLGLLRICFHLTAGNSRGLSQRKVGEHQNQIHLRLVPVLSRARWEPRQSLLFDPLFLQLQQRRCQGWMLYTVREKDTGVLPRPQPHCSGQAVVKKATTTPQILGLCCCYVRISDFGSRVCSIVLGGHTRAQTSDGIDIVVISGLCGRPVDWWAVIFYEFPHLIWTWNSRILESHC